MRDQSHILLWLNRLDLFSRELYMVDDDYDWN